MGKNAVKDSARFDNGPLHRALTVCMTTEKRRPPWAMDDHSKKLIKLDLYKKLTDPRVNAYIKRHWFEQVRGTNG